jgi:tetratricopeptide (TPR) repeat protein
MLVPDADLKRLGMRGPDVRKAERLRDTAMTVEELAQNAELAVEEARKLVYLLLVTGLCAPEHAPASGRSGVRSAVTPVPPPAEPKAPSVPAAVPNASRPPSVRPRAMSPRPSPAPGASMPAWQQLASLRAASRSSGSSSGSVPAAPAPVPSTAPLPTELLDDAGKVRRAEQLLESNHHADATRIADELLRRSPSNASYHALRAFALCQSFSGQSAPRPLLDAIDTALRLDPQQPRALYVRGLVCKRLGKEREALRWFQRALEADPNHIDALRELRLAKLRRDK